MSWKYFNKAKVSQERALQILSKPVITEKATLASGHNQVLFEVCSDASKPEIKQAVEQLFKVKVKAVNSLVRKGKTRRFRGRKGMMSDRKLAYITLQDGQVIDVEAGV